MALEITFRSLTICVHRLHDALSVLEVTLGDKPANDEAAVADGVETNLLDIMGTLHDVRQTAILAETAVGHPADLDKARRTLMQCQGRFHDLEQQFTAGLSAYEQLKELARLGSTRKQWQPWSAMVRQEIEQCQPPLLDLSRAFADCWQELVEHSGQTSISIRTENLGQKIVARELRGAAGRA